MTEFCNGGVYHVSHTRKGEFVLRVVDAGDEWIKGTLVSGNPRVMNPLNSVDEGEEFTARRSFLTIKARLREKEG